MKLPVPNDGKYFNEGENQERKHGIIIIKVEVDESAECTGVTPVNNHINDAETYYTFKFPGDNDCMNTSMPRHFGPNPLYVDASTKADTAFYGVDIDHKDMIIAGGATYDVNLLTDSTGTV